MRKLKVTACLLALIALNSHRVSWGQDGAEKDEIVELLQLQQDRNDDAKARNAHVGEIADFAFLPDGTLLTGGADGSLRHWNVETGEQLQLVAQQASPITRVAVSPDGQRALSFSAIGAIRVWRLPEPTEKAETAASPNGRYRISTVIDPISNRTRLFKVDTRTGNIWQRDVGSGNQRWREIGPENLRGED
jgi:WD40 repeat protein